ncbi:hypothetical protein ACWD01_08695 [Streptomyces sp. NPDC002835]
MKTDSTTATATDRPPCSTGATTSPWRTSTSATSSATCRRGARTGELRDDVPADEPAGYCLHALTAAGALRSKAAVRRLVTVTLSGLRPER